MLVPLLSPRPTGDPPFPGRPAVEDWNDYVYQGVGCVGAKGEISLLFNKSLVLVCIACVSNQVY